MFEHSKSKTPVIQQVIKRANTFKSPPTTSRLNSANSGGGSGSPELAPIRETSRASKQQVKFSKRATMVIDKQSSPRSTQRLELAQSNSKRKMVVAKLSGRVHALQSNINITAVNITKDVDDEVYHGRRKKTNYMVGVDDLEDSLCYEIQKNTESVKVLQDQILQQSRDFEDYKR